MSDFINTIELQGDEETLCSLVNDTQTEYRDDKLDYIRSYAFSNEYNIVNIDLPKAGLRNNDVSKTVCVFQYCYKLKSVKILSMSAIPSNFFYCCYYLTDALFANATRLMGYAFQDAPLGMVVGPNVATIGTYLCQNYGPSGFDFSKYLAIASSVFNTGWNFSTLILRSSQLCPLSNVSAFTKTPIAAGYGWIYVPDDLVNTYKSASNWSTYAARIVPLSQYPKEFDGGTITDTWAQIFAAEEDGTYKTKYSVGDTKAVDINGACVLMQIVAFDEDDLSDNSGKAKITWLSQGLVGRYYHIDRNLDELCSWEDSHIRKYIDDKLYTNIQASVKSNIKSVKKKSNSTNSGVIETNDLVWIPSVYEIVGNTVIFAENIGATYVNFFATADSRKKYNGPCFTETSASLWSTRTMSGTSRCVISASGTAGQSSRSSYYIEQFPIGFCT